jgi:alkanesulfonate monooxygenase SsuD/methylene tetrahydromethanopterin reductase-like flavin-dependent oxidoreductase (luciferase family)
MRIGLITQLHGRPDGEAPAPTWESIKSLVMAAEDVEFDMFVFEDALLYRGEEATDGCWESMTIAGAIAAATDCISFGQSVVNNPYRSPALVASMATTLDEISGGRYVLGIGAGNTWASDYAAFGFPSDRRYSRFAESIEIIHSLLRTGSVDFAGEFYTITDGELVLRGPAPNGPIINIAGGGSRMLRLVAEYADDWNWWGWDETLDEITTRLTPIIAELEKACDEVGRNPGSLGRTFDLYSVVPPGMVYEGGGFKQPVRGSADQIASFISGLEELGFTEVRLDLTDKTPDGVAAMAEVVDIVHDI